MLLSGVRCPNCNQIAIDYKGKLFVTKSGKYKCRNCGHLLKVGIAYQIGVTVFGVGLANTLSGLGVLGTFESLFVAIFVALFILYFFH